MACPAFTVFTVGKLSTGGKKPVQLWTTKTVVALLIAGVMDRELCLWQAVDGQLTTILRSPRNGGYPILFSPDGQLMAAAGFDHVIRLWSTASGIYLQSLHGHTAKVCSLAFSPDGRLLASGTAGRIVYLWDLRSGHLCQRLDGHVNGVEALAFSPDGRTLASGSLGTTLRLWNLETRTCQQILRAPGPYTGMNITGVTGISATQKVTLRALGAFEK